MQPRPPSVTSTFSSSPTGTLYPLNNISPSLPPPSLWQPICYVLSSEFNNLKAISPLRSSPPSPTPVLSTLWIWSRTERTVGTHSFIFNTSLVAQMVKRLPATRETRVRSLGWEDLLEKETATHSSTLAWRIPRTEEPGRLQSMGLQRVGHDWATLLSLSF